MIVVVQYPPDWPLHLENLKNVLCCLFRSRFAAATDGGCMGMFEAGSPSAGVAAHLRRARAVLARPGVWIQGEYALDVADRQVDSCCSSAHRFCCSGALYATERPGDRTVLARVLLAKVIRGDIETWNDAIGRERVEVLAAFDRAIAMVTAAPGSIEQPGA